MTSHIKRWDCSARNGFELIELDRSGYLIMLDRFAYWWTAIPGELGNRRTMAPWEYVLATFPSQPGAGGRLSMKIIETDNYGGDYPNEKFLNLPLMNEAHAQRVADAINAGFPEDRSRFWRVVGNDYQLAPGFEP